MKALPKTHVDLLRQLRPLMIAAAERRAARVAVERGDDLWALTTTEQIACGAREDFDAEIERFLGDAWKKTRLKAQRVPV
ncbi:hypothetical protein [Azospirillum ramasamyi]|uniref:Uncharacterized protein n=1 Tax=Azospirillum ramasamyi TaxID=682998 RepID=A0A2U9S7V7_9PROT|nr:hypothetical protein [Azospirillum ramasamyi]AWU95645.1 hypothetical protein DM194_15215 [Azospirillum ramasamyi]